MKSADYWIEKLNMHPHPEGGYFCEVYRSGENIDSGLPERYSGSRSFSSSIYFLLKGEQYSAFHRLRSDEIWHLYYGSPTALHVIFNDGRYEKRVVGLDLDKGEKPQAVIPKNCWFAAEVIDKVHYSLVGCTVSPGFDYLDFELAEREKLIDRFPQHAGIIKRFT